MTDQQLLESFRRDADGNWTCVKPILFDGSTRNIAVMPGIRIGQTDCIYGIKLGHELEAAAARTTHPVQLKSLIHH
jgi:hypothetical protein